MKSSAILITIIITGIISTVYAQDKVVSLKPYPVTKKVQQTDNYFGTKVDDPYRWLEDDKSKETEEWVNEENAVTQNYLEQIPYRKAIKNKLTEIWNYQKMGVPEKVADKLFYLYNSGVQNQDVLVMASEADIKGKIIIDPNKLSPEGFISIVDFKVSHDGRYLAYSVSEKGSDWNRIYIFDLKKMNLLNEVIDNVKFSEISWYKDGFYYSKYLKRSKENDLTALNESQAVFYHVVGKSPENDKVILSDDNNPLMTYAAIVTDDEKYLIISASQSTSGNAILIKPIKEDGTIDLNKEKINYNIPSFDDNWEYVATLRNAIVFKTNYHAPNYQLVMMNPDSLTIDFMGALVPERNDGVLTAATIANKEILIVYMMNASSHLNVYNDAGVLINKIKLPSLGTIDKIKGWPGFPAAFFSFSSFTQPRNVYQYDMIAKKYTTLLNQTLAYDPDNYVVEQVKYTSFDQVTVPMFIVYKKGVTLNGSNPALLYGYGGFNESITPTYNPGRMLFIDNGGILAIPSLRGGGEFGEKWHMAGTKERKQTVFNDFIAAAQYLIDHSYTSAGKLAIQGASNGGLLVGACMTQRPELFKVALPAVGVMDMLRYHLFTIGWSWKTDYGSSENATGFNYLYKYSPLHNIKAGVSYPATLVTTGDHDDRVVPAHSFKFIATLQEKNKGSNPMLIRIQTNAGHGGGKPTSVKIDETSDILAFTFYNLGMDFKGTKGGKAEEKDNNAVKKADYINNPVYRKNLPTKYEPDKSKTPVQEQQLPKK